MELLVLTILLFAFLGMVYYHWQNKTLKIGGAISKPKTFWLFFALFCYFILPVLFFVEGEMDDFWRPVFLAIIALNFSRLAVQGIWMYWLKSWRPPFGMAWNIFSAFITLTVLLWRLNGQEILVLEIRTLSYAIFIMLYLSMLLVDTYYAYCFHLIVGYRTTGKNAVWFANATDPRFRRINRITLRNNVVFALVFLGIILFRYA